MNKKLDQFNNNVEEFVNLKKVSSLELLKPIQEGKWSIREIVGHIYYWDKYNLENMVPEMNNGATLPPFPDHDQQNAKAISDLSEYSIESIMDSFVKTRKELIEALEKVGDDVRFTIGKGKRRYSKETFVKIFVDHDAHHLDQIGKMLSRRAEI